MKYKDATLEEAIECLYDRLSDIMIYEMELSQNRELYVTVYSDGTLPFMTSTGFYGFMAEPRSIAYEDGPYAVSRLTLTDGTDLRNASESAVYELLEGLGGGFSWLPKDVESP